MAVNILITGGIGYIGSNLIQLIIKKKIKFNKIIIIDNLVNSSIEKKNKLLKLSNKIVFFKFDINNKKKLSNVLKKYTIDTVFHLAALKSINDAKKNPIKYIRKNILDSVSLINVLKKYTVKNIIFASTAGVYEHNKINENTENDIVNPTNPYSFSKRVCEYLFYQLSKIGEFNVVVLRLFNVMGHIEFNNIFSSKRGNVSDKIISSLNTGKNFIVNSKNTKNEGSLRDFIHVEDVCEAKLKSYFFLKSKKNLFEIFNIGSGKSISIKKLIKIFNKLSSKKIKYKNSNSKSAGQEKSFANISKSFQMLKWKPKKKIKKICLSEINALNFIYCNNEKY